MIIHFTKPALKQLKKLPESIKKKAHKQFKFLLEDIQYPSLRFKKMANKDRYEGTCVASLLNFI